jgi:hypothetical protein
MKFNPKEVFVINTEDKLLPFKSSVKIKNKVIKTWPEFESVMKDACGMNPRMSEKAKEYFEPVKIVFVDSFTRILYLLSKYLKSQGVRGHDFWKEYRDTLEQLLMDWKTSGKQLVFTAIDEVIQDSDSVYRTVVSVDEYYDIANTKLTPPPVLIVGKSGSGKSTSLMYCVNEEIK